MSFDAIGKPNVECQHCGALRFKAKHDGICCGAGTEAKLSTCLSSLVFKQKIFANFSPSVIFHGKVVELLGPLQHEPGKSPCYAQLDILDTDMQTTIRSNNMNINPNKSMN